jgi:hypothetical protein
MIMPSDKAYKETKQIMLGKRVMKPEFIELAEWIDKTYGVKTINIIYDTFIAARKKQSRLQICFEFERESLKFRDGRLGNFHETKQIAISQKFQEILRTEKSTNSRSLLNLFRTSKYATDNILIVFSAFEPIARIEANESVPESKIKELKNELENEEIWEISQAFSGTTIFLYTDEQVKKYEDSEEHKKWTDKYFELLSQFDEFGYFKREFYSVYLDSKENFDNNYESNWYYYYK